MAACTRARRGAALGIVLLLMTVLFILGGTFVEMSNTEIAQTRRMLSSEQLRYAAEAGITYAQGAHPSWSLPHIETWDDAKDLELFGATITITAEPGSADSVVVRSTAQPASGPAKTLTVEYRSGAIVRWTE